jgi:hypothetical protein
VPLRVMPPGQSRLTLPVGMGLRLHVTVCSVRMNRTDRGEKQPCKVINSSSTRPSIPQAVRRSKTRLTVDFRRTWAPSPAWKRNPERRYKAQQEKTRKVITFHFHLDFSFRRLATWTSMALARL